MNPRHRKPNETGRNGLFLIGKQTAKQSHAFMVRKRKQRKNDGNLIENAFLITFFRFHFKPFGIERLSIGAK